MAKRIDWLEQFANDQYKQMTKTASREKIANQIIVDRSSYPNAKVGSLIDFDNAKYKVVDTKYHDKSGPGLLLEEITASLDTPDGEVKPVDGTIPATSTEQSANCGDCCAPPTKTAQRIGKEIIAAKDDDDSDFNLDLSDLNFDDDGKEDKGTSINDDAEANNDFDALADFDDSKINVDNDSEYPSIIPRPGGVKPMPSAPIEGPGKKHVTDAPYHPTYDPGEQYALERLDGWQDAADRTAKAIEQEDTQDRTTVEGHYTWNQYIDAMLDGNDSNTVDEGLNFADNNTEFDSATETEEDNLDISEDTNDEDFDLDTDVDTADDVDADDVDTAVDDILGKDDEDNENDSDLDIPDEFNSEEDTDTDIDTDEDLDFDTDTTDTDIDNNDFDTESDFDNNEDFSNDEEEEDLELPAIDIDEEKKEASNKSNARPLSRLAYKNR